MKSLLLLFFSLWMVVTSSCGIKYSLRIFNSPNHSSVPAQLPERSNNTIQSESFQHCALKGHKTLESLSVEAISILKFLSARDMVLFPLFLFLLSFLIFATRRKEKLGLRPLPGLSSPPLYIQFRRLQYYA